MVVVNVNEFVIVLDRVQISSYDATPLLTVLGVTLVWQGLFISSVPKRVIGVNVHKILKVME
jgi:hypothetical protein